MMRTGAIVLVALLAACSGETLTCAAGTVNKGGSCVPVGDAVGCGAGTHAEGGVCVPDQGDSAGADSAGVDTAGDDGAGDGAELDTTPACVPLCAGRDCGDDGCGGSCGTCSDPATPVCGSLGVCVADCKPECSGKSCGPDGCGGSCGSCSAGTCSGYGQCVPDAWTCSKLVYGASDACDCGCGAKDPDCTPGTPVAGCGSLETCDASGACVSKVPKAWTCLATAWDALDACDCGCGADDPDCAVASLPIKGCKTGETCSAGVCQACTPACNGKTCGDDGCGGSCGTCDGGKVCDVGQCVDPCKPTPIACKTKTCGDDGCGGSCGSCAEGEACTGGSCAPVALPEAPTSCVNHCGSTALSGCACTAACVDNDSCCDDYKAICTCKPDCKGKTCGDDGCGGSCGSCGGDKPYCDTTASSCVASCTKQCDGKSCGDDGCGGQCGSCASGSTCSWAGQCVPDAWQCPIGYYADGTACDCGCGAPDPDCAGGKLATFGCPTSTTSCDMTTALCKVSMCKADTACAGQTCVGVYAAGGGTWGGVCGAQTSGGKLGGQPCQSHAECKSAACLGGLCRSYCQQDAECPSSQRCLGVAVEGSVGGVVGFGAVCDSPVGSLLPCKAQADCKLLGESCQAFVDATTLGPRYLCASGSKQSGASCALASCPGGQICVTDAKGSHCGAVCPAGAADCSSGTCGSTSLHNAGTTTPTDDPKVPVCVQ